MTTLYTQIAQEYRLDAKREQRAKELYQAGAVSLMGLGHRMLEATVNINHHTVIQRNPDETVTIQCSCLDWKTWGLQHNSPCKHVLALALLADANNLLPSQQPAAAPGLAPATTPSLFPQESESPLPPRKTKRELEEKRESFASVLQQAVAIVIDKLADQIEEILANGATPLLIGPTGCGKTSATRQVALRHGWGFEEVAGSHSFADADIVGLRTDKLELPGVLARAFKRARAGETVLLLIDELLRFNQRAQDILMRPLQSTPVAISKAMGLPGESPLRIVEAPLWGIEYAPLERVPMVLAANPWGAAIDPALIRRVEPIQVALDSSLLTHFSKPLASAIEASWKATERGELPLPVEYQSLLTATRPDDGSFLTRYLTRLQVVDKAAADGFGHLLSGMGVKIG